MKIVIPGGTGQIGSILVREFRARGDDVVVLSRGGGSEARVVDWDGRSLGAWTEEIDGCDAVINCAGRSVNCRYSKRHLRQMMNSRVDSTRAVGLAIERAQRPPAVWLQMSTATIYAHRFDGPNDEETGVIGGREVDAPDSWRPSITIARAWERALARAETPHTRKVALRSTMVMSSNLGGTFDTLLRLTRWRLGGPVAGGSQLMSWVHERDFVRAVAFLIDRRDLDGVFNVAAPFPLSQREFMDALRAAWGARLGLPANRWMLGIGAFFLRTEPELILKSRWVVPARLLAAGFRFEFPEWPPAARDLVGRWRAARPEGLQSHRRQVG